MSIGKTLIFNLENPDFMLLKNLKQCLPPIYCGSLNGKDIEYSPKCEIHHSVPYIFKHTYFEGDD